MGLASLTRDRRDREFAELAEGGVVDLLVVGGGVTGTGVALDAASRGLSVALVEASDLAFGTSRWSSKLVHGGLRYLASGDVGLAHESAVERGTLMVHTAPHLIRALPMLMPLLPEISAGQAAAARGALTAADALRALARTPRSVLPGPRRLGVVETRALVPGLRGDGLRGSLLGWDGQLVDDARLVVSLARTAAAYGARILTRVRADELSGDGAVVTDLFAHGPGGDGGGGTGTGTDAGGRALLRARAVVNATGVWADTLARDVRLRPSRGTHLILRDTAFGVPRAGITVPVPGEHNRYIIVLPQANGLVYVGLTDEAVDGVEDVPTPTEPEIDFLLGAASSVLATPLARADVIGTYAGLRPLLATAEGPTADLSRRHAVLTSPSGVVTVVGGKLTTYRRMAQDAVDTAVALRDLPAGRCRTRRLPLVGAAPRTALDRVEAPARLVARYGTEAAAVVEQARAAGGPGLLAPVADGLDVTGAELLFGLRHEGALDVDDLLDRRTRLGLVPAERAAAEPAARAIFDAFAGTPVPV
jgi:glycerol-3-phosphate dehydrogenase